MRLEETTIARLGLLALTISLWKSASWLIFDGLLPRYPAAVGLLIVLCVASFALLLLASSSGKATRVAGSALLVFGLITVAFVARDTLRKASSEFLPTNDGHLFMDVAARSLLAGKNPYLESLAEAFRVYRMPLTYATPLLDGDFTDRQAYPALSFLVLVPAVLLHVPTYLVFAAAYLGAVAIVVTSAPWWARPFVVAAFTLEESYYALAFGGVTDTVWVLFVIGAIAWWWKRPTAAAVLVGLACAYKQHPWFLVPLLVVRLAHDHGEPPWGRAVRRFVGTVAATFIVVNVPFALWGPRAWFSGITEPLFAPMIQLSEGLTALSMAGWIPMPRSGTSLVFWAVYALVLFVYARHTAALRDWCWVVPGVVLWFGYRALMSYWYFFALTAVMAMVARSGPAEEQAPVGSRRSWRLTGLAAALVGLGVTGFVIRCGLRPYPLRLAMSGTVEAWDLRGFALHVRVENQLTRPMLPQFFLQSNGVQPLPWVIDFGPRKLAPGQAAEYIIRSPRGASEFDVTEGARLEVRDRLDPGQRGFVSVPGERTIKLPDAVPNPSFRVVETRTRVPSGWTFDSTEGRLEVSNDLGAEGRVRFEFASDAAAARPASPFAACVMGEHVTEVVRQGRRAALSAVLPLPEGPLSFRVNVPVQANRPPYDDLYGLTLAVSSRRVVVLFGEATAKGTLPSGEAFTSVAAPRGAWTTVEIAPRAILERLGVPLTMSRHRYARAPALDVPSTPLELGLFATAPAAAARIVEFGPVGQREVRPYEELAKHPSPAGLAAWRAELDLENGNYAKAAMHLEVANGAEPTAARLARLGDAYLLDEDYARARDTFARALEAGATPEAEIGLGYALLDLVDLEGAGRHFELARSAFQAIEAVQPRWRYLNALRGLTRVAVLKKDCPAARRYRDQVVAETPALPPPDLSPCP